MIDKKTRGINYKLKIRQNEALPLNGMHSNSPSIECWTPVGPQAAQARPEWTMLMRGRSLLGQSSRYLAMMTRPVLTKLFKAWSMIVILIPVYDILISLQSSSVCPRLACIELLISLHNDRHLSADGFVTVRQIAMKFKWDKENVSCLKLVWKKLRLPHLEPRCRTG